MSSTIPAHALASLKPLNPPRAGGALNSLVERVRISIPDRLDHAAPAILHLREDAPDEKSDAAVVLVSGAGGGVSGPGGKLVTS
jgi:hypothetical protein